MTDSQSTGLNDTPSPEAHHDHATPRRRNLTAWSLLAACTLAVGGLHAMRHLGSAGATPPDPDVEAQWRWLEANPGEPIAMIGIFPPNPIVVQPPRDPFVLPPVDDRPKRSVREQEIDRAAQLLHLEAVLNGRPPAASLNERFVRLGDSFQVDPGKDASPVTFKVVAINGRNVTLVVEEPGDDLVVETTLTLP